MIGRWQEIELRHAPGVVRASQNQGCLQALQAAARSSGTDCCQVDWRAVQGANVAPWESTGILLGSLAGDRAELPFPEKNVVLVRHGEMASGQSGSSLFASYGKCNPSEIGRHIGLALEQDLTVLCGWPFMLFQSLHLAGPLPATWLGRD
jgi:hypothetical protein